MRAIDFRDSKAVSAGGNDIIRPGSDPDALAERYDRMIETLRRDGATVVLFTGPDVGMTPVLGMVRGKTAIYNEHLQAIALKHGALVTNLWALRVLRDPRMWAADRLHHSPLGHATVAAATYLAVAVVIVALTSSRALHTITLLVGVALAGAVGLSRL